MMLNEMYTSAVQQKLSIKAVEDEEVYTIVD
jgi:hypothetical protein